MLVVSKTNDENKEPMSFDYSGCSEKNQKQVINQKRWIDGIDTAISSNRSSDSSRLVREGSKQDVLFKRDLPNTIHTSDYWR